ncbi:GxxExxY protein [Flavobacterium sp. H122]|uniref:GxxExxY protein n=1 Tax=Flavobacterium sp. H122 TaxID=2529860 RepID=UPI0010AA59C9|nr:GxxExxY protein [Flavobacterium sp. H122]
MKLSKNYLKDLVYQVNGVAIEVHKHLGPGLLESVYHKCLKKELELRNISFVSEFKIPIHYKGLEVETDLRLDLLIEDVLVVELKAVEFILPVHEAQILTYMKLLEKPKGLLINFNVSSIFYEGQRTFVNELYRNLEESL